MFEKIVKFKKLVKRAAKCGKIMNIAGKFEAIL